MKSQVVSDVESLLLHLLSARFPGSQQLRLQIHHLRTMCIDANGSLRFVGDLGDAPNAMVTRRIPIEAERVDTDGVCVHALLHVVDGKLWELEIYKDDSSLVLSSSDAGEWHVLLY